MTIVQGSLTAVKYVKDVIYAQGGSYQRVYIDHVPQTAAYPHIVLNIISREESETQDNGSAVDTYRIQIDVYAKATSSNSAFYSASEMAEAIRTALSRNTYEYVSGDPAYAHNIDGLQESNYFTEYIDSLDVQRISMDFLIRVKEQ